MAGVRNLRVYYSKVVDKFWRRYTGENAGIIRLNNISADATILKIKYRGYVYEVRAICFE